jgi:hemin uptake protein HemP
MVDIPAPDKARAETPPSAPVIESDKLFQGKREIFIDHQGERYRLRITRKNKLILQK